MNNAYKRLRDALALMYRDRATIYINKTEVTPRGTIPSLDKIHDNIPCKLSTGGINAGDKNGQYGTDNYDAMIYIGVDIDVPAGATIDVLDANGYTTRYKRASKGYTAYLSHREVAVVRDDKAKESANG
jgi:hypothetical protein